MSVLKKFLTSILIVFLFLVSCDNLKNDNQSKSYKSNEDVIQLKEDKLVLGNEIVKIKRR